MKQQLFLLTKKADNVLILFNSGELICDENGEPIKIRGKRNVGIYFKDHKDVWKKVYDKCYEKLSKKEEDNIISFDIICHFDQWQLEDFQLRPYRIAAEIDSMIDKKHLTGIGNLNFLGAN